jgi:hypothetical protein
MMSWWIFFLRQCGQLVAVLLLSLLVPALLVALITGPVLLRAFGPVTIAPGWQPVLAVICWVLTFLVLGNAALLAERHPEYPAMGIFTGAATLVLVAVIPAAVFAWSAVTDWSYQDRGGVTTCTVEVVEKEVHNVQSALTGSSHAVVSYRHTMDCDAGGDTEWVTDEPAAAPDALLDFEYDATGRFELRPAQTHWRWQTSARIALILTSAASLLYLVASVAALRHEATGPHD